MTNNNEFSKDVCNSIKNYVYRLIDPRNGETFYVGRGVNNRVFQHVKGCENIDDLIDKNDEDENWKDSMDLKRKRIIEIINENLEVIHVIHRHGLEIEEAKIVEATLIDAYPGLTNIMGGEGSNAYGPMHWKQLQAKYQAEEFKPETGQRYIFININNSITEDNEIYRAARYAWVMDIERAKKADFVLAESRGIIKGVFSNVEWRPAADTIFEDLPNYKSEGMGKRIGFIRKEDDPDKYKDYINKRSPAKKRGAANPIRYIGYY